MKKSPPSALSARLRKYRTEKRLTQLELAQQLGVSQQTVARWESATALPTNHLEALAELLEVDADTVLALSERPVLALAGEAEGTSLAQQGLIALFRRMESGQPLTSEEVALYRDVLGLVGLELPDAIGPSKGDVQA